MLRNGSISPVLRARHGSLGTGRSETEAHAGDTGGCPGTDIGVGRLFVNRLAGPPKARLASAGGP